MDFRSIIAKLDQIDSKKMLLEDATTIASMLKKSMSSWWGDDDSVYMAIQSVSSAAEWEQVKRIYSATGKDVEKDLAKKFSGEKLEYIKSMLASQGVRSNVLNINPVDHLTPIDFTRTDKPPVQPAPAAEPEGQTTQPPAPNKPQSITDDPSIKRAIELLDKAEGIMRPADYRLNTLLPPAPIGRLNANESISRKLIESFGYVAERLQDLTTQEYNDLVDLANELVKYSDKDEEVAALMQRYLLIPRGGDDKPTNNNSNNKPPVNVSNGNVEPPNEPNKDKPENDKPRFGTPWNSNVAAWQTYLISKGHNLGPYGPKGDGIDGRLGLKNRSYTRRALKKEGITDNPLTTLPPGYQPIPKPASW